MVRFSVIVPIYNVSKYLKECIDSIINGAYQDFEIILVDDGSGDSSSVICDEYSKKDKRIKVIHKKNGGLISARKAGALLAQGEYIVCVDGDDCVDKTLLSTINEFLDCYNKPEVVGFGYKRLNQKVSNDIYHDNAETGLYIGEELNSLKKRYLYDNSLCHTNSGSVLYMLWAKAIKRELYINLQLQMNESITNGEDTILTGRILEKCNSYYCSHVPLYFYRTNEQSMTNVRRPRDLENVLVVVKELQTNSIISQQSIKAYYIFQVWIIISDFIRKTKSYKRLCSFVKTVNYKLETDFSNVLNNSWQMRIKKYCVTKRKYLLHYLLVRLFKL